MDTSLGERESGSNRLVLEGALKSSSQGTQGLPPAGNGLPEAWAPLFTGSSLTAREVAFSECLPVCFRYDMSPFT